MAGTVQVTSQGAYVEQGGAAIFVTALGAYVELGIPVFAHVTSQGAYVEQGGAAIFVTALGAYVEFDPTGGGATLRLLPALGVGN